MPVPSGCQPRPARRPWGAWCPTSDSPAKDCGGRRRARAPRGGPRVSSLPWSEPVDMTGRLRDEPGVIQGALDPVAAVVGDDIVLAGTDGHRVVDDLLLDLLRRLGLVRRIALAARDMATDARLAGARLGVDDAHLGDGLAGMAGE